MQFSPINFLAIAIGTLTSLILGLLWYSPKVFGRTWRKHSGLSEEEIKTGTLMKFGPAIALTFLMGVVLAAFLPTHLEWDQGAFAGMILGAGVGGTSLGVHYLFEKRSFNLFLIDAGYIVLSMTIFGAVISAMS